MRERLAALIRLKLILARNRFFQKGAVSSLLQIFMLISLIIASLLLAAGALWISTVFVASSANVFVVFAIYSVLCFVILSVDFIRDIEMKDMVDIGDLLYLPVALRELFLFNFIASLANATFIITVPLGFALALGCAILVHPMAGLAVVPVLFLGLALAAWIYSIRSWITRLMMNKRKWRSIVAFLSLSLFLLSQAPYLFGRIISQKQDEKKPVSVITDAQTEEDFERMRREDQAELQRLNEDLQKKAQFYKAIVYIFPPGWVAVAAGGLAEGRLFPEAVPATGGLALLGLAGLGMGYRSAHRHYYGTVGGKSRAKRPKRVAASVKPPLTLRSLPLVSEQTAAMAWAFLLTWWRQPQVRNSLVITLLIGAGVFLVPMAMKSEGVFMRRAMLPVLVIAWPLLSGGMYLFNAFGADPEGFRALVLTPVPRRALLLGVNLGLYPLVGGVSAVFIGLMAVLVRPGWQAVVACLLLSVQVYVLVSAGGNFVSVLLPYRFQWPGGGRRKRGGSGKHVLPGFAALGCMALAMVPALGILGLDFIFRETLQITRVPIALLGAALLLIASVVAYVALLPPAARLLEAREQGILEIFQKDQE